MSLLSIETGYALPILPSAMDLPRMITAAEILAERQELRNSGMDFPHNFNARCGVWVYCDCPPCRDYYDPTGEESAKYLNMEYPSWFDGQSDVPSFYFSKLAKESYLGHRKPGFYIGNAKKPAALEDVILVLTPPLPLKPKRILHVVSHNTWDEFLLSDDKTSYTRRSYVKNHQEYVPEEKRTPIPFSELPATLKTLYS
jgi:hypothetical protein